MLLPIIMADATARRIHIVGGPASGTSQLARRLGQLLAVPVYDLDAVAYEAGTGTKRTLVDRRALVAAIAQQSGWVTQGVYLWWCEPLTWHADRIVWLDVPWRVAAYRIIRRHRLATRTRSRRQPGLAQRVRLAWATRRYYLGGIRDPGVTADDNDDDAITRAATREWLEPYRDKLMRCAAVRDLGEIVSVASGKPGMRRDD